jgi:hypothetical protein
MMGHRPPDAKINYPVSEVAAKYGASVDEETDDPRMAYARRPVRSEPGMRRWPISGDAPSVDDPV